DPDNATHFYNYLRSRWKNGLRQCYGGNGYSENCQTPTYYMFPGDSDPEGWGTDCVPQAAWSEPGPTPATPDRRFVQSAGPFTLQPGAFNNITVGVVFARAQSGGAIASLNPLRVADDKAQALFDNCFKILDGPDAPNLDITELDRELILFLSNPKGSNNEGESYVEKDPLIPFNDGTPNGEPYDRFYHFQGYEVYQMKNADATVSDIGNIDLARLVYQGDLKDSIGQIINYPYDDVIGQAVPTEMVHGADAGIKHSIRVTRDLFAQEDPVLVNFKTYYFIAIAYGYNNYKDYEFLTSTGQAASYIAGRKAAFGSIHAYAGIPHKNNPQFGGTQLHAAYGDGIPVTRLEGQGNGALELALQNQTSVGIAMVNNGRLDTLRYEAGRGPINVKVIDPLKVPAGKFEVWFQDTITPGDLNDAYWFIRKVPYSDPNDVITSDRSIALNYEQLLPEWGISITLGQVFYPNEFANPIGTGSIEFSDPSKAWFTGIPDGEGQVHANW
ncbi:MAG TPA: T9SS C-terminal target domain-containing protein, partial [Flavobacteriales bacterium]|nr:T9SS C-terminal target domain-containing protein [Flavobacteriales bacterium]